MESLLTRHRNMVVLLAAVSLQLVLLAWQVRRPDSEVPLIREWVRAVVSPPQRLVSGVSSALYSAWDNYIDLRGAREQARRLEEEVGRQRILNHQLRNETLELARLRALAGFQSTSPSTLVAARIVGAAADDRSRSLYLNKGSADGLRANMPVITPEGIVGKIRRVTRSSAQVLLITDEESGVGVLLEKSRVHGVLRGREASVCDLLYVLNDEKVEPGETVYTSGEDGVYPKGLPVGAVARVSPGGDFKRIEVAPLARLSRLEEVLVVVKGVDVELPGNPAAGETAASSGTASAPAGETGSGPSSPANAVTAIPKAATSATAPAASSVAPAETLEVQRPGIPRGARPETDADRIRAGIRQRFQKEGLISSPPAADALAPFGPIGTQPVGPATKPAATKPQVAVPALPSAPPPRPGVRPPSN